MFITPMSRIDGIEEIEKLGQLGANARNTMPGPAQFQDVFKDAIQSVKDTDQAYMEGQYLLATGQIDDTHTVPIYAAKAQLSVDLLIQLRTKALEAYNELLRTNL